MISQLKYISILLILIIGMDKAHAQDPHFSQFYANPLYMSPSLAGSTDGARLIANYRNQWPGINKAFETYAVSFDNFFQSLNSGIGFMLYQDKAGSAGLTSTQFGFQYSYNLIINDEWQIIPGIQFTYGNKFIDFNKLLFVDEMQGLGGSGAELRLNNSRANYMDFAASAFLYSHKYWFGITLDHLAQPNYSFLNEEMRMPLKTVFFGGVNIWTERSRLKGSGRSFSLSYRLQHSPKMFKWTWAFIGLTTLSKWVFGTEASHLYQRTTKHPALTKMPSSPCFPINMAPYALVTATTFPFRD